MSDVELAEVESFALDHTLVRAPYVRKIAVEHGPRGDAITNYDIRLVQPNAGEIPTAGLHTIEHTIAGLLRTLLKICSKASKSPFSPQILR